MPRTMSSAGSKKPDHPIICIDFDGVLHSYTSGWQGVDVISDDPVPGAIIWLSLMLEGMDRDGQPKPVIYSSRSKSADGILAMMEWLLLHGLPDEYLERLEFPTQKPAAFLTIDDRAVCFTGKFPPVHELLAFKPWNRQES